MERAMDGRTYLILFITRTLTATFLFLFMRRDRGREPRDGLAEAFHDVLNRRR
jgi:hypothetical protein